MTSGTDFGTGMQVKVTPEQFRINLRAALKDLVVHKIVQHEVIEWVSAPEFAA
jgi:hypothetical protein